MSFVFMGFAFYELSGGDDFVPRKAEAMDAAKAIAAAEAEQKAGDADLAHVRPESATVPQAAVTRDIAPPVAASARGGDTSPPEVTSGADTSPVMLASLQSGLDMVPGPVIRLATPRNATPAALPEPEPADIREVAGSRVNVRLGPGTGYGIVTRLPRGTSVEVIENDGAGWVKLRTVEDELIGWMAEYLLTAPTG